MSSGPRRSGTATNEAAVAAFYAAFARLDADTMAGLYAPEVRFQDEAFTLSGRDEVMAMWRMLVDAVQAQGEAGRSAWRLQASAIHTDPADARLVHAHWEPHYRFSATGRLVHNVIDSRFSFNADGEVVAQRDRFNFWRWSRQALGTPGLLLGWSPFLKAKVRAQAGKNLARYRAKQGKLAA